MYNSQNTTNTFLLVLIVLLSLTGCASKNSLTKQELALTKTISILPEDVSYLDKPELFYIQTKGRTAASSFGLVGALIYEGAKDDSVEEAMLHQIKEDDLLTKTVAEAFQYTFSEAGVFASVKGTHELADAHMNINVEMVQIIWKSKKMHKFNLVIEAELVDNSGTVLWKDRDFFTAYNDEIPYLPFNSYLTDKQILKQSISIVAQMIAREFIIDMGVTAPVINRELHGKHGISKHN